MGKGGRTPLAVWGGWFGPPLLLLWRWRGCQGCNVCVVADAAAVAAASVFVVLLMVMWLLD